MNPGSTSRWQQAQTAYKAGERQRAWALAQEAAHEEPLNYRVWLMLAALAPDGTQSLAYVARAERLQPDDPTVRKARAWAERRPPVRERPQPVAVEMAHGSEQDDKRGKTAVFFLAALVVLTAVVGGALFLWQMLSNNDGNVLADVGVTAVPTAILAGQPLPSTEPTATATAVAHHHLAKQIAPAASSATPRPQWTITPTPTITPSPTPTLAPTFVSEQNPWPGMRPFGVGPNERWIDVDLSAQTLYAYEGDNMVYSVPISSGTTNHPTVTGMFRIYLRYESQTMNGYLLGYDYYLENVPHVMYFYRDYALHGAYWHNNFGQPMSHGCVNLQLDAAAWLYEWASYGTVVNVHE
jgi:lipoprotein-anchoring transpeptidase ErfK/SrfK